MTARKVRPAKGDAITPDMSLRAIASALACSTALLCRAKQLAKIPKDEFERRRAALRGTGEYSVEAMLRGGAPVPAPGRVERAKGIVRAMTGDELQAFLAWIVSEVQS